MLVRTSSGNTSVGHLSHSPHGFSKLHRPDVTFSCGGLLYPVHSLLLAVTSRFFTDFFAFVQGKMPEVISLDAVKCEALNAVSLGYYLEFVYSGALPAFDAASDALDLLRLSAFFCNVALTAQLSAHLAGQLGAMPDEAILEVFKVAVELKQRRLVTECLVLLLPQFGRCTADSTVAAVIDLMDATLSKAVLTQLAMQGAAPSSASSGSLRRTTSSSADSAASDGSITISPRFEDRYGPGRCTPFEASAAAELESLKTRFVAVLDEKGWGQ